MANATQLYKSAINTTLRNTKSINRIKNMAASKDDHRMLTIEFVQELNEKDKRSIKIQFPSFTRLVGTSAGSYTILSSL